MFNPISVTSVASCLTADSQGGQQINLGRGETVMVEHDFVNLHSRFFMKNPHLTPQHNTLFIHATPAIFLLSLCLPWRFPYRWHLFTFVNDSPTIFIMSLLSSPCVWFSLVESANISSSSSSSSFKWKTPVSQKRFHLPWWIIYIFFFLFFFGLGSGL